MTAMQRLRLVACGQRTHGKRHHADIRIGGQAGPSGMCAKYCCSNRAGTGSASPARQVKLLPRQSKSPNRSSADMESADLACAKQPMDASACGVALHHRLANSAIEPREPAWGRRALMALRSGAPAGREIPSVGWLARAGREHPGILGA